MIADVKNIIIPALNLFCGVSIIEAEQNGDKPNENHVIYKFTTTRMPDIGRSDEVVDEQTLTMDDTAYFDGTDSFNAVSNFAMKRIEQFKMVISFTSVASDNDDSEDLASKIYEWFDFHGSDLLQDNNIAVVDMTSIQNRDIFLVDEYERRNGFDVTLRVTKEITKVVDYIETVVSNNQTINVDGKVIINGNFNIG